MKPIKTGALALDTKSEGPDSLHPHHPVSSLTAVQCVFSILIEATHRVCCIPPLNIGSFPGPTAPSTTADAAGVWRPAPRGAQCPAHETSAGLDGLAPRLLANLELLLTHRSVCLDKRPEYVSGSKDNMVIFSKIEKIMEASGASNENGKVEKAKRKRGKGRFCGREVRGE